MATIKHLTSKNSNYAAAESYLTFQHNEYTGLPIPVSYTHLTLPTKLEV